MTPERYTPLVARPLRDVLRLADELVTERLRELGFVRGARGIYERPTESDSWGWLGLNQSVASGVQLLPFVGVRHRVVEAMLKDLGASAYSSPLATVQLGYLTPERAARSWAFQGENSADVESAEDLVRSVERFALPFIESNANLPTLAESVEANADEDSKAYVLPVIYRLMEQPQLASRALDSELRDTEGEAGADYRRFVDRFMRS
jgi:hypothetical protein